jgi:hypothetical protein
MGEPLRHRQTKEAETDMFSLQPPRHISTLPIAGIILRCRELALRATLRHVHRKTALYSITSSARVSSASGTVMPRAFAVFRLRINSTFVDCWTGKSAGLAPLRMRPV